MCRNLSFTQGAIYLFNNRTFLIILIFRDMLLMLARVVILGMRSKCLNVPQSLSI